jgi:nucleotide-binding universal stress UspA family protein
MPLVVLTVETDRTKLEAQKRAQEYLTEHRVSATFAHKSGPAAEAILKTVEEHGCDLIIMGSYGPNPLVEVVMGSTVDDVLRTSRKPVLICR